MPLDQKTSIPLEISTKDIAGKLRDHAKPDNRRAIKELAITIIPLIILWNIMWLSLSLPYIFTIALGVPTAFFLMRLFIIQHDCGHDSFFETKKLNDRFGNVIGIFTYTPYEDWRHDHALHHAWSGNLDHRGFGDLVTLTLDEYESRAGWKRLRYWLFRQPILLFTIFPLYQFIVRHRWPTQNEGTWKPFISAMFTNLGIIVTTIAMASVVGWWNLLLIQAPIIVFASGIGVWLFFVQHQFEETHWDRNENWAMRDAAFHGSSYYDLPKPFMWVTGYIGAHHVHHLSSRVPSYRLPEALKAIPELDEVPKLTFVESLKCAHLALWDEKKREMLTFAAARRLKASA